MKRLIALAALLVPLWGCTQPAEAPTTNATTTNINTSATTTTTATNTNATTATVAETAITDQEKKIWAALKAKDMDAFGALLAEDFILVTNDGIHDKQHTIASVKNINLTEVNLSDWQVVTIDKDAAVVTYMQTAKGTDNGQPIPATPTRNSSVWINRGGKWVAIYHQDCEATTVAAAPPVAANSPAKATNTNANTSAPPAAAEAADPIAKEKQVWEELKRKDWDAFASDLAAEQMEVEPGGVHDKAGSIAGVKDVDFSKTTLSELKQVRIDEDAAIVTYLIKDAGSKEDRRASTVWIKRGDKWLALFHHGTPVMVAPTKK